MKFRVSGIVLVFMAAVVVIPAQAQKKVAPTQAAVTRANRAAGKPMMLNGIRETVLPNGLTVLTKEVHAAPVVYFSVFYAVGSVDEEIGQTGMSHLMEHMMFKGTKKRGPGVISATLQENGASFNASTWDDRTEYHETLAADRLELAMQIESDRMVNSLYDEAQHQKEMVVVRSEYEAGENNPGTALDKAVRLAAYQVHPYRWTTIGFRADIENFTRDEMYAYYKNYYTPNNATVVIVGDFDTTKALTLVRKYFGVIKPHPVLQHFITPEPAQEGPRRVTVSRAGTTPLVEIAYHMPGFGSPDRYALDVLENVLSGGRTGRFFLNIIQPGLASSADAGNWGLKYPDLLTLSAAVQPGHTPEEVEKALLDEVDKIQKTLIEPEELARTLRQAEAEYIYGKESVTSQGSELGENAMKGDWRYGETYVQQLRKVTREDVQRVARQYLVARNSTTGYFLPTGGRAPRGGEMSTGGAPTSLHRTISAAVGAARYQPEAPPAGGPAYYRPTEGGYGAYQPDRPMSFAPPRMPPSGRRLAASETARSGAADERGSSVRSGIENASARGASASGSASRAKPVKMVLSNGLTLVVQENHANPTISMDGAMLSAGAAMDPPDRRGLASFTVSQLSRGTTTRSLLDIARALEDVDASVGVGAGDEYLSMSGRSLTRDFDTTVGILADELRNPSFPADEIEKARAQALAGIQQARQQTGVLADIAFANALYPKGHPYSEPTLDEREAVIKSLTRDELVQFHDEHYAPDQMILTIVGDVTPAQAEAVVKKYFGDWPHKGNLPKLNIPTVAAPAGPLRTIVVTVPDKAQVDVRYGFPASLKRSDPDFYADTVLTTILGGGGGLSSRLALNVRDRLGLVYGIGAGDNASLGAGPFQVVYGSNPANVDRAAAEMLRQVRLIREKGVTSEELKQAVDYLTGSYPVRLATNGAVAGQLLVAQVYGLGLDYIQKHNSYYKAVTLAQVNAAARKYLPANNGVMVIVGTYKGKYAHG